MRVGEGDGGKGLLQDCAWGHHRWNGPGLIVSRGDRLTQQNKVIEPFTAATTQLANGLVVGVQRQADAGMVCLDLWCDAGSRQEGDEETGMAHFLEHMVFRGSETLPPGSFDLRVEAMGGSSNAATGFDDVHYHVLVPPPHADEALALLTELILSPQLAADAFAVERLVVLEELSQSEDQPDEVVFQRLLAKGCGSHAYGRPVLGYRRSLEHLTPASMDAFHGRLYRADGLALAITGAIDPEWWFSRLEHSLLGSLPRRRQLGRRPGDLLVRPGRTVERLERLEAARLLMLWPLPKAEAVDALIGAELATTLLSEGRRSLLVRCLREELCLVESVDLEVHPLEDGSMAILEAVCPPDQLEAVEEEIHRRLSAWCNTAVHPADLQRAQRLLGNGWRFGLEGPGGLAAAIGPGLLRGRVDALGTYVQQIQAWSCERLLADVQHLFAPEHALRLLALPAGG